MDCKHAPSPAAERRITPRRPMQPAPRVASMVCAISIGFGVVLAAAAPSQGVPGVGGAALGAGMQEFAPVTPPRGWTRFCDRSPEDCAPEAPARPWARAQLTDAIWTDLVEMNRAVNYGYAPRTDQEIYGVSDYWTLPGVFADCEDYVLEKRRRLLEAGWPPESLLIGVVRGTQSPYHAVLIVRTDAGEFVLDNLTDSVLGWRETGYEWVIRQSAADPSVWVRVEPGGPISTGDDLRRAR